MDAPAFHELDRVGNLSIGDAGEKVCIAIPFASQCWKIERYTPFEAKRIAQAILDAAHNANLNLAAGEGYPDIRPAGCDLSALVLNEPEASP